MIDWTKPVRTRVGNRKINIFTTEAIGITPIVGQIDGYDNVLTWNVYGDCFRCGVLYPDWKAKNIPEPEAPIEIKKAFEEGFMAGYMSQKLTVSLNDLWINSKARQDNLGKKVVDAGR